MYLEQPSARIHERFGFDWQFKLEEETSFRPVQLPHDWSVEYPFDENAPSLGSGGYVKTGIGIYEKMFLVSPSVKGKKISLHFDGAYMCASAVLNGHDIGGHVYGYTPFELDITEHLNYGGENVLTVRIDNSRQPGSRWYSGSGITRDVWIKAVSPAHVKTFGTFIRLLSLENDSAVLLVETDVVLPEGKAVLVTSFFDSGGALAAQASAGIVSGGVVSQTIKLSSPELWSAKNPYMYKAHSALTVGSELADSYFTPFGIRQIEFSPDRGFVINGERVKLRGVCLHHDGGSVGAAVPAKVWQRRLERLADMGVNAVRFSHNPPDSALLDLCDTMGLYVMDEAFDEWSSLKSKAQGSNTHESRGYSEWFAENHEADLTAMLLRDRNHPSVILWSIGNEVPEQSLSDGHKTAKRLIDICKKLDPARVCTHANDQICAEPAAATEDFLNALDVVGYNYTGRWRTRAETFYENDKRNFPNRVILGAENTSAGGMRGDYRSEEIPHYFFRYGLYYMAAAQIQRLLRFTENHDYAAGDFMWTGIDYLGEAHWPYRSTCTGVLDTCGFPKDHYYFYKSIWRRDEPFVYIFPHWNLDAARGSVVPVICYTNCEQAEIFVNGKSYGKKASSYPRYGMSVKYGHYQKNPIHATTDDMFLAWDAVYEPGSVTVVGYNGGAEACRQTIVTTGSPARLSASADADELPPDGLGIAHIEVRVNDAEGLLCPFAKNRVFVNIEGPAELIGIDNGRPDCMDSFKGRSMEAAGGLLLVILRSAREKGKIKINFSADKLESCELILN